MRRNVMLISEVHGAPILQVVLDDADRRCAYREPAAKYRLSLGSVFKYTEVPPNPPPSGVPQTELVSFYRDTVLPKRIAIDLECARQTTFFSDLSLLSRTMTSVLVAHIPGGEQ